MQKLWQIGNNAMRRLNYSDTINSEKQTSNFARSYLGGANDNIPKIFDALVQLMCFAGEKKILILRRENIILFAGINTYKSHILLERDLFFMKLDIT